MRDIAYVGFVSELRLVSRAGEMDEIKLQLTSLILRLNGVKTSYHR